MRLKHTNLFFPSGHFLTNATYSRCSIFICSSEFLQIYTSATQKSLIPDFISNSGMARVFAYFMERRVQMTDEAIFNDTSNRIKEAIQKVYNKNKSKTGISATAFEIALNQLI